MLEKTLERIMRSAHTPEGKIVAVLLAFVLSFAVWNNGSMGNAFADESSAASAQSVAVQNSSSGEADASDKTEKHDESKSSEVEKSADDQASRAAEGEAAEPGSSEQSGASENSNSSATSASSEAASETDADAESGSPNPDGSSASALSESSASAGEDADSDSPSDEASAADDGELNASSASAESVSSDAVDPDASQSGESSLSSDAADGEGKEHEKDSKSSSDSSGESASSDAGKSSSKEAASKEKDEKEVSVPYHVVDASDRKRVEKSDWIVGKGAFVVNADTSVSLASLDDTKSYADVPNGFAYAFACVSDSLANCSEERAIKAVSYNTKTKRACVTRDDGTVEELAGDGEIYLVFFAGLRTVDIGYKVVGFDGALGDAAVSGGAPRSATLGSYDMQGSLKAPLSWKTNGELGFYAYAIGESNAGSDANLYIITTPSQSDASRPALKVKKTWRGFSCSTDGGSMWVNCGYDIGLYVVYFESEPSVVTVSEKTFGNQGDMEKQFAYNVSVMQTVTTYTREDVFSRSENATGGYVYKLESQGEETQSGSPVSSIISGSEVSLSNDQTSATTLFYTEVESGQGNFAQGESGSQQYWTKTVTIKRTAQSVTINQDVEPEYETDNDSASPNRINDYAYTCTAGKVASDRIVTFENKRTSMTTEAHVALASRGGLTKRDDLRTGDEGVYELNIPIDGNKTLLSIDPDALFTRDMSQYGFAGVVYGMADSKANRIAVEGRNANSLAYGQVTKGVDNIFGLLVNGNASSPLGDSEIYFAYYPLPKIYFVQEGANGELLQIDPIAQNGETITLDEAPVTQGAVLGIPSGGLSLDQTSSTAYRVPSELDGKQSVPLEYVKIGAGEEGAKNTSELAVESEGKLLFLDVVDGQVQYSLDGSSWSAFDGAPAVFVIYKEKDLGNISPTGVVMNYRPFVFVLAAGIALLVVSGLRRREGADRSGSMMRRGK